MVSDLKLLFFLQRKSSVASAGSLLTDYQSYPLLNNHNTGIENTHNQQTDNIIPEVLKMVCGVCEVCLNWR